MTAPEDDDQRDALLAAVWRERFGTPGPDGEVTWPRAAPPRRRRPGWRRNKPAASTKSEGGAR